MHQRGGVFDVSWPYANRAKNFGTMHVLKTLIFAGSKQHHAAVFTHNFPRRPGILNVMRGRYASSTFQPPLIPSDSAAPVWVDDSHEQARESGNEIVDLQHCKSLES